MIKRRLLIALGIMAVLAISGLAAWRWASTPVEEAISISPQSEKEIVKQQPVTGTGFRFALPATFTKQASEASTDSREHLLFSEGKSGGKRIAITSGALPADGLGGVSDYNLRQKITETYAPLSLPKPPANSAAFHKIQDTAEVSLFWQHNGRYASVAVTGSTATEQQLEALLQSIATSWRWQ